MSRFLKAFRSSFAASSSSAGMSDGSISMIVTSVPKRLKIDANSQPMIPPPRMTSRRGTSVCARSPVESTQRGASMPGIGGGHGVRTGGDDRLLEGDLLRSLDRDRVRAGESATAVDPLHAVRLEERGDAARHLVDDGALPPGDRAPVERRLAHHDAELRERLLRVVEGVRALHPGLGGDAAHAQAGAAEGVRLVDAGDLRAELRGANGGRVPGRAASEDGDVDVHSVSVPSFVGDVGSSGASMVRESASSPTWEKPWRSYSSIAPALLRSTLSEIDP